MLILAEITVPPSPSAFWQLCLVVGLGANLVTILTLLANRKQRREISHAFEPASKADFADHVKTNAQRHAQLFAAVEECEKKFRHELEERARRIENRLDDHQRQIEETLRDMPNTIVAQLLNTKHLWQK
jgi:hypothetical protein